MQKGESVEPAFCGGEVSMTDIEGSFQGCRIMWANDTPSAGCQSNRCQRSHGRRDSNTLSKRELRKSSTDEHVSQNPSLLSSNEKPEQVRVASGRGRWPDPPLWMATHGS